MGSGRVVIVNGPYIAEQHVETQILHAEHVHQESDVSHQHSECRIAEDVAYEEMNTHFRFITEKCVKNSMVEHVESHLRIACTGTAETLWKCIHEFEFMGYLSTKDIDATKIYNALCEHFGALNFTERNFRKYR